MHISSYADSLMFTMITKTGLCCVVFLLMDGQYSDSIITFVFKNFDFIWLYNFLDFWELEGVDLFTLCVMLKYAQVNKGDK